MKKKKTTPPKTTDEKILIFAKISVGILIVIAFAVLFQALGYGQSTETIPSDGETVVQPSTAPANPSEPPSDDMVMCTMDVQECPDGTFVGRVAPDCEFEACPGN